MNDVAEYALPDYVIEVQAARSKSFDLPENVTIFECENGCKVYLVGTAHFSEKSNEEVRMVVNAVIPDFVLIELCSSRVSMLTLDNETLKQSMRNLDIVRLVSDLGASKGVLQYLLLKMSNHVMEQLGMPPGGEFRAAYQEAMKQKHCHVILGDRPVGVTLNRAFESLGFFARIRTIFHFMSSIGPIDKEEIEKMKNSDMLDDLIREMGSQHPELIETILNERDRYLCRSIWDLTGMKEYRERSAASLPIRCCARWPPAEAVPRVVVAVVGYGHVAGISRLWPSAHKIDHADLIRPMPTPLSWRVFTCCTKIVVFGTVAVGSLYLTRGTLRLVNRVFSGPRFRS